MLVQTRTKAQVPAHNALLQTCANWLGITTKKRASLQNAEGLAFVGAHCGNPLTVLAATGSLAFLVRPFIVGGLLRDAHIMAILQIPRKDGEAPQTCANWIGPSCYKPNSNMQNLYVLLYLI